MRRTLVVAAVLSVFMISCGFFSLKSTMTIKDAINYKQQIDQSDNPAYKYLMAKDLSDNKRIELKGVLVKDITVSGNIDYDFCVIVSVPYEKMNVECFVYSQEVKDISRLVKDKTRVDVTGDFSRFFTLLDESYTKIEITNAEITIRKGDK